MPSFMGKSKEQRKLIDNLTTVYGEIAKVFLKTLCIALLMQEKGLAMGDFPDPSLMKDTLRLP